ncbi:monofunctional biosynthetic peptidoglycan transglycosylase [Flavivirga aquatica]|nr:monofunctional biosynthetic peptidoglycan transglycosylase [Flavivirga aquatica]
MKRFFRFIFKLLFWIVVLSIGLVVLFKYVPVPITPLMVIRYFENETAHKKNNFQHDWVPIDKISKKIQLAVICSEDQKFKKHNGFDIAAIERAYKNNKTGKRIKGGSTISQQTAKNVFLWPERSWLRKGLETYFTFLIEKIWTKERILEVYLNSIEMGDGIYGAEAASQYWFNKPAVKLTAYEAAAIASILPNPRRYRANPASVYIQKRKEWIVSQMHFYGTLEFKAQK